MDKVTCTPSNYGPSNVAQDASTVDYCFRNFKSAVNISGRWREGHTLPHKYFPMLLLAQGFTTGIFILMWKFWLSRDLSNHIKCIIEYSNNMTEYYRKYDKSMRTNIPEASLHREIDNFLEYLAFLLMQKSRDLFKHFVIKCVLFLFLSTVWIIGNVLIFYPDFRLFQGKFVCLLEESKVVNQRVADCTITTTPFLRVCWYISVSLVVLLFVFTLCRLFVTICYRRPFQESFFYMYIPGIMDSRLGDVVNSSLSLRYCTFVSNFCEDNVRLCKDLGMSRSLTRKYGVIDGTTPGRETIVDRHFPVIQPQQIKKFRISAENYSLDENANERFRTGKVRFSRPFGSKSKVAPSLSTISVSAVPSAHRKHDRVHFNRPAVVMKDSYNDEKYMTSRLLARKLEKEMNFHRVSSRMSTDSNTYFPTQSSHGTPKRISVNVAGIKSSSSNLYGSSLGVKYTAPLASHYTSALNSRNRDFDPYA